MTASRFDALRAIMQVDVGNRGLRTDPVDNLTTAYPDDLYAACRSLAGTADAALGIVTGFFIPHGEPPAAETDGPLGAIFLARVLVPLGMRVVLASDAACVPALVTGLAAAGLRKAVSVVTLPSPEEAGTMSGADYAQHFADRAGPLTHLVALERVGPSHTPETAAPHTADYRDSVPAHEHDRCHSMRGRDLTALTSPAHRLLEQRDADCATIGIGDGGNELGMGKLGWDRIRRNIPGGDVVACRVATDYLLVAGVSNWGAYALAAGTRWLRGAPADRSLFDPERERDLLALMVERGPLVDGVTGQQAVTVDGLDFDRYAEPLRQIAALE